MQGLFRMWIRRRLILRSIENRSRICEFRSRTSSCTFRRSLASSTQESSVRFGPSSWRNFFIATSFGFTTGIGVYFYIKRTLDGRAESERKRLETGPGVPSIGGDWELVDFNNNIRTDKDFLGKWLLIYFGFTHCPDICPEELEKLCNVMTKLDTDSNCPKPVPLFFTVDPVRDTPERLKEYCEEFSPHLLGLGGTNEQVKAVCKKFRVYFGMGPKDTDGDYIVDHTVAIYLMDPNGKYVNHFIREPSADVIFEKVRWQMMKRH